MAEPPLNGPEATGCVVKEIEKILYKTLKNVFHYDSYRSLVQKRAVEAVANSSQDVFVSMPTGAGKSLCYQLPSLVSERKGVTIVVSPLIALMNNQINQMKSLGIITETINSKMTASERERVRKDLMTRAPQTKLLYISPELANTPGFHSLIDHLYKNNNIARIIIDEAHCVSQWGHSFRPDYLNLGNLKLKYPSIPWVALTATASIKVMDDILTLLKLSQPVAIFKTSCFRPNLFYDVIFKETLTDPYKDLIQFAYSALGDHWEMSPPNQRGCGIIYCRTRDACEELSSKLTQLGLLTQPYHAGMKVNIREETQTNWMEGKLPVIAATVSFGMGIDKSTVRFVVHWCVSQSVAAYYQESGRAGRDGKNAKCRIYYSRKDRDTILFLMKKDALSNIKNGQIKNEANIKNFNTMIKYCEEAICRHYIMAREFGDDMPDCRKHCDVCTIPKIVEQRIIQFKNTLYQTKIGFQDDDCNDLYGGGKAGIRKEYEEYYGDEFSKEGETAKTLSKLINDEFNKRRGIKNEMNENFSTKVLEPTLKKIPEVSISMREQYYDKLVDEIKLHLESCSSNNSCPSLNDEQIKQCAAEYEVNSFKTKGNIHMYRRDLVNLFKSLREASRQIEIHPLVMNFIPPSKQKLKSNSFENLNSIVNYFSKNKINNENKSNLISHFCTGSHKIARSLDASQEEEPQKKKRTISNNNVACDNISENFKINWTFCDSGSESSEKNSFIKASKHQRTHSELSKTGIDEAKPMIKYFFESVSFPMFESSSHLISSDKSDSHNSFSSPNKTIINFPEKSKKSKIISELPFAISKNKEKCKTISQMRNDNLKKAADLVRKHLNPEYKANRISKDFFKIVCRSISHRLVESGSVTDSAAKFEVNKLLNSDSSLSSSR